MDGAVQPVAVAEVAAVRGGVEVGWVELKLRVTGVTVGVGGCWKRRMSGGVAVGMAVGGPAGAGGT